MSGPGRLDQRPEGARDQRVSAEEQRERRGGGHCGELTEWRELDVADAEEIGGEALGRGRPPPEVREEHTRVEEHAVAELAHPLEELFRTDLLVEEAERGARGAGDVASGGLHP